MTELVRSSHKVFKIKYHIVFCIKYRKDLFLKEEYISTVKKICKDIEDRFYLLFETIGFDEDPVNIGEAHTDYRKEFDVDTREECEKETYICPDHELRLCN